ncbi:MAG: hypothetical protein KKA05_05140 [Alphaproteobacteria bacterium]|nr:hypothetical protein [Alphaproteobacteria bacterium]
MTEPYVNEIDVLQYLAAHEDSGRRPVVGEIYARALAHPWRMAQILEALEARKLITLAGCTDVLKALEPLIARTKDLDGPQLRVASNDDQRRFASRGVPIKAGETVIDAGMASASFNRLARDPQYLAALTTPITVTAAGRAVVAALDPADLTKAPRARPFAP